MVLKTMTLKPPTTAAARLPGVTKGCFFCWNQTSGIHAMDVSGLHVSKRTQVLALDILTLERVHRSCSERSLFGIVGDDFGHPCHCQGDHAPGNRGDNVQWGSVREGAHDWCYRQQGEDDDGNQVGEQNDRPSSTFQGAVGDPDACQGVYSSESIAECGVFILLILSALTCISMRRMLVTYNLSDRVDHRFAFLVVCLEPEDKGCERLRSKWLHCEDEGKQNCFPACQETEEGLDGIWLAFGFTASQCHPLSSNFQVLHRVSWHPMSFYKFRDVHAR